MGALLKCVHPLRRVSTGAMQMAASDSEGDLELIDQALAEVRTRESLSAAVGLRQTLSQPS